MFLRIETLQPKKLVGMFLRMSLENNQTFALWRTFMPRRDEIKNTVGNDLISMQIYDPSFNIKDFNLQTEFTKWAVREVSSAEEVPEGMQEFDLPGGLYAVFLHKGPASAGSKTFQYIFGTWLPGSGYVPDNRPHFEILGEKYKNEDPSSEEEIWIPVRGLSQS